MEAGPVAATQRREPKQRSMWARPRLWFRRIAGFACAVASVVVAVGVAALGEWAGLRWWLAVPVAVGSWQLTWRGLRPEAHRKRSRQTRWAAGAVVLVLACASWSYTSYLTAPGFAPFDVRTADWLRDHGFDPVVDAVEYWLYGRHAPGHGPVGGERLPRLPAPVPSGSGGLGPAATAAPEPVRHLLDDSLPGEGRWSAAGQTVDGVPVLYTTYFRPDPSASSVLATAAWIDQELAEFVYVPGVQEPGGGPWSWGSEIPTAARPRLVAAFNSGFKLAHIPGGVFVEGTEPKALVAGQASLMIDGEGRVHIGAWGDPPMVRGDHVVAVRQNLGLIVADGQPVPGLMDSGRGEWGRRKWQLRYTRRSAIGITASGAVVYVSGNHMTLGVLADALASAGAVVGMQLDIHHRHPTFNIYQPAETHRGVRGTKLDPTMAHSANRYLAPDQRDFFAVLVR